jgi:anhydro-N-acetylmuramic acid kinase
MYYWEECMDKDGQLSEDGRIDQSILTNLLKDDFVQKKPPKSTGRDKFGAEYIQRVIQRHPHISPPDLLRTFIAFTAKSIVENMTRLRNFTPDNFRLIISGGGVHHPLIMQDLSQFTGHGKIFDSNKVGINPDMKESLLMAILGVACVKGIPANMPSVTGADRYAVLGEIR